MLLFATVAFLIDVSLRISQANIVATSYRFKVVVASIAMIFPLFVIAMSAVILYRRNTYQSRTLRRKFLLDLLSISAILLVIFSMGLSLLRPSSYIQLFMNVYFWIGYYYILLFITYQIANRLISVKPHTQRGDVILILGSNLNPDSSLSHKLKSRLDESLAYIQQDATRPIIVSGGLHKGMKVSEADQMANYLIAHNVAPARIIQENKATNTFENLFFTHLLTPPDTHFLIITHRYHLMRVSLLVAREGMTAHYVGATDSLKYTLPSIIREFVAYLSLNYEINILMLILIIIDQIYRFI